MPEHTHCSDAAFFLSQKTRPEFKVQNRLYKSNACPHKLGYFYQGNLQVHCSTHLVALKCYSIFKSSCICSYIKVRYKNIYQSLSLTEITTFKQIFVLFFVSIVREFLHCTLHSKYQWQQLFLRLVFLSTIMVY